MSVTLQVDTRNLQIAMGHFTQLKNKSDADVVNKAMRYWLPFSASKVKKLTKTAGQLRRELTGQARRISRGRNKSRHQLTNSVAAAIIAARLRERGRTHFPKADGGPKSAAFVNDFYEMAQRLVNAKVRSVNFLRAGFIPAFRQFSVPNMGGASNQVHFKGHSRGIKAIPKFTGIVEAYATNQREGAFKIAPNAFSSSIPEVTRQFIKWIDQDTRENARKSGFY